VVWDNDTLDRKADSLYLTRFLSGLYESKSPRKHHTLNLNAPWGLGKTYFLTNWKEDLEKNHPVIYYNAWENDFTDDPLLSFIVEIESRLKKVLHGKNERKEINKLLTLGTKIVKPAAYLVASTAARAITGYGIEAIAGIFQNENGGDNFDIKELKNGTEEDAGAIAIKAAEEGIRAHKTKKDAIKGFKASLNKLIELIEKNKSLRPPIFILVDELDRCRPSFAIELLEAIKHLFETDGIFFIIATDSEQLAFAIHTVYGEKFDSKAYLKRFFDREYQFKEPDYITFVKHEIKNYIALPNKKLYSPVEIQNDFEAGIILSIARIFQFYKLSLRDQRRFSR